MNIILDIGNTTAKVSSFSNGKFLEQRRIQFQNWAELDVELRAAGVENILLSSVRHVDEEWLKILRADAKVLVFDSNTPVPLKNNYKTPETLGADRLANAVAVSVLYPESDVLVVDFGTCIKYDLVSREPAYEGGAISPGMDMRFRALHNFTDKLPLITYSAEPALIGRTTEESIRSGVINGIVAEVSQTIKLYQRQFPELKVVATGGDQEFFDNFFKNSIFAHHFLTALGLHEILTHNL